MKIQKIVEKIVILNLSVLGVCYLTTGIVSALELKATENNENKKLVENNNETNIKDEVIPEEETVLPETGTEEETVVVPSTSNSSTVTPPKYNITYPTTPSVGSTKMVYNASTQIGNIGGKPYWSWYGFHSRVDWCAIFVSWVANESGYIEAGIVPKFSLVSDGIRWFKARNLWRTKSFTPKPGDIIFFDWEMDGTPSHTGIVVLVENGMVYTIEGNSKNAVREKSYPVNSRYIVGYGVPSYDLLVEKPATPEVEEKPDVQEPEINDTETGKENEEINKIPTIENIPETGVTNPTEEEKPENSNTENDNEEVDTEDTTPNDETSNNNE